MKVAYFPGCTLKTNAKSLEQPGLAAMAALGVELVELERWNCCGVVFSLADDDLLRLVAPVRDLIRVKEQGFDRVVTMCSMCNNTLAQANLVMREDVEKRDTINAFMEEEPDYAGEVEVQHLLAFLRDEIGWDKVRSAVKHPLGGIKVAPYYGCTLVRPIEVGIDSSEQPRIMGDFLDALGADAADHAAATECCGAYQVVSHPAAAAKAAASVIAAAEARGAEAIASACPLCEHNLVRAQATGAVGEGKGQEIPSSYFTQLLAVALGVDVEECRFDLSASAVRELLEARGVLDTSA